MSSNTTEETDRRGPSGSSNEEEEGGINPEKKACESFAFSSFASRLRESLPTAGSAVRQTLDGLADVIHKSATTLATEFAEMEREAREHSEREKMDEFLKRYVQEKEEQSLQDFVRCCKIAFSKLPWEVWRDVGGAVGCGGQCDIYSTTTIRRGEFVEDQCLKQKILALSLDETTFTEPFLDNDAMVMDESSPYDEHACDDLLDYDAQYCYYEKQKRKSEEQGKKPSNTASATNKQKNKKGEELTFLEEHAGSIRRLLEIDENLKKAHSSLSGTSVKESIFWRNYFYHCERLRVENKSSGNKKASLEEDRQRSVPRSGNENEASTTSERSTRGQNSPSVFRSASKTHRDANQPHSHDDQNQSNDDQEDKTHQTTTMPQPSISQMAAVISPSPSTGQSWDMTDFVAAAGVVAVDDLSSKADTVPRTMSDGSLVLIGADDDLGDYLDNLSDSEEEQ